MFLFAGAGIWPLTLRSHALLKSQTLESMSAVQVNRIT